MKRLLLGFGLLVSTQLHLYADGPVTVTQSKKASSTLQPFGTQLPPVAHPQVLPANQPPYQPGTDSAHSNSVQSESPALSPVPAMGQKKWEALLNEPADLDFGDRKSVTVDEIIRELRRRHNLSLRLDIPTLASLVGTENLITPPKSVAKATSKALARNSPNFVKRRHPLPVRLAGGTHQSEVAPIVEADEGGEPTETVQPIKPVVSTSPRQEETPPAAIKVTPDCEDDDKCHNEPTADDASDEDDTEATLLKKFLTLEISIDTLDLKQVRVATLLRQTLDAMPLVVGSDIMEMPMPISLSNACLLDYLVEKDGLVITTRMQALAHKETRVYSIKHLKDVNAEQLVKIIRQSVRPWSWRTQINDLGDQLRGSFQVPPEVVKSIVTTGVQLAAAQTGATVTISESEPAPPREKSGASDAEQLNAIGNATVNGLVTFAHATISGLEMVHHADFPTGTIFSLPGKLVVTQSQATHREIADLLKQLSEE